MIVLVVGAAGAVPASQRAPGRDVPRVSSIGTYTVFSSNGGSGALMLNSDGTFTTSYGDSGQWLPIGTTMAMVVGDSSDGDTGCLYIGTLKKKGINSKSKQGPTNCEGSTDTWYAIKVSNRADAEVTHHSGVESPQTARDGDDPVGSYIEFEGEVQSPFTVNQDGSATLARGSGATISGYWTVLGKAFGFTDTSSSTSGLQLDCLFLGMITKHGIGSAEKPGLAICPEDTQSSSWYAAKD